MMTIVDPRSFQNGGIVWTLTWGDFASIRYSAAGVIESYDYLCSSEITMEEATRRLRLMRQVRAACVAEIRN